ncbi:MAG: glycosyltransferase [Propionibacteriaceae bacterium]|nr:glycosyltransferase [Propionibacteriaceae bacterium]
MTSNLRIGILSDDFYPHSGGVSRSIQQQIDHLAALGHEVTLFVPQWEFEPPANCRWEALPQWRFPGTPSYLCSLAATPGIAARVAAEHALDVVHSQNERGSLYLGALVAHAAGIPQVHTFHSNYVGTHRTNTGSAGFNSLTYLPLAPRLLALAGGRPDVPTRRPVSGAAGEDSVHARRDWRNLARIAAGVDAFTSPAGYMIDCIVDAAPELAGRGHVVPSGIDPLFAGAQRRRAADDPTVRVVTCSRLGSEKRVDALVRAVAELNRPDIELVIIGTGPAEPALRRLAEPLPAERVRFLGRLDAAEVAAEMADADVYVLASYHIDTQGMVLAEAAAAGTPIYCDERLQVGVSPANALLTGPSPSELAAGLAALADDPERRRAMAEASREIGGRLTGETMARTYLTIYREAIERVSGRSSIPDGTSKAPRHRR